MPSFANLSLTGERVLLRPLRPADAPAMFAMMSDPDAMRYWASPPMTDIAEAEALIAGAQATIATGEYVELGIERRADGIFLGKCILFHFHPSSRRAEVGYILAREHWGAGYMHEALTLLLDFGFGPLGLHRVEADIDPRNEGSRRTLERLGFTQEGVLRERWIIAGEISDTGFYGLLSREWHARRAMRGVTIRETAPEDLPTLYAHQADPDAAAMAAFPSRDREAFDTHWKKVFATPGCETRVILLDGVLAGSLASFPQGGRRYIGYWVGREFWGRGVATQGLAQLLAVTGERPLYAYVAQHNIGSIRVLEKCGFVRVEDDTPAAPPLGGVPEYLMRLD